MTITRSATSTNFQNFLTCVDESPVGTFDDAKDIRQTIGGIADTLIRDAQAHGLKVCNCDGIFNIEVEIYGYLRKENVDRFLPAEGYGASFNELDREAQREMNRRLESDRYFLAEHDFIAGLDMMLLNEQPIR